MAPPYSPFDIAVGNDRLPLLQLIAQNQRRVAAARQAQPIRVGALPPTPMQSSAMPAGRAASPAPMQVAAMSTPASQQQVPSEPAQRSGIASIIEGMSPDERRQMTGAMLGGAAANLSNLMAGRPNAGVGELLLAAGAGTLGGQQQAIQGIRLGRQDERRGQLLERQIATAEAKAQQEMAQAEQARRILEDPSVPVETKRIIQMSMAGVPAAGIEAMVPQRMTPYQEATLRLRERELSQAGALTPYQQEMLAIRRMEAERAGTSEPLVEVFDQETGQVRYAPRSQAAGMAVPPTAAGSSATALQRNVPFVAKAMNISEREATEMLLQSASGRKSPEQIKADFAKTYMQNAFGATPEDAVAAAENLYGRIYGGAPPPQPEAEAEAGGTFSIFDPSTWLPGGGAEAPVEAAPAQQSSEVFNLGSGRVEQRQQAATGSELPMMGDGRRPDPSKLQTGTAYRLPNGEVAVWDGTNFVVQ